MRIVYCHFLASCISRLVFRLGTKSNNAQKKRCVGEFLGSAFVQTVYIFSAFFCPFSTFFVFFRLFLSFLSFSCPLLSFSTFPYPFLSLFHILLLFSPLIFCLIPLFNISLLYPFIFLSLVITSIPFPYLLYIPLCTSFILCPYSVVVIILLMCLSLYSLLLECLDALPRVPGVLYHL